MYPESLKYSESHVWVRQAGTVATLGITSYAQEQLGEVVYLELPQEGDTVAVGDRMGSVESVKSISDVYSPVSGTVVAVNEALLDEPGTINADPYEAGWLVQIEMASADEGAVLLSASDYQSKLD
jgi:glycine cleavage system H protein